MPSTSYLQWLARRDKDLPMPAVRVSELWDDTAAGSYFAPHLVAPNEWRVKTSKYYVDLFDRKIVWMPDGELVSFAQGLIVINPQGKNDYHESELAATLAHEWRHHWQAFHWGAHPNQPFDGTGDHRKAIVRYFSASPFEAEALRFELSIAPGEVNLERASWLGWPTRQRTYLLP